MSDAQPPADPARKRDRRIGLFIISVTFVAALCISWMAKEASRPETSPPPGPPTTAGVIGYPSSVDPIKTLPAARKLTLRTMLRGIDATGVKSDGTVDLGEGPGSVRYTFQSPPGKGPQPPHDPNTVPRRRYCGRQVVELRHEGLAADPDVAGYSCPTSPVDALPDPRCDMRDVWRRAIAKGAPKDRLAHIEYYRARGGPAWRFDLPGTSYHFVLYGDCGRELHGDDTITVTP